MKDAELLHKILAKIISLEEKVKVVATRDDLRITESKMMNHVDDFLKLHLRFNDEFASLLHAYSRLDSRLEKLEQKCSNL